MRQPVIIVGAARSGTKYLRDILATSCAAAKVPYDINYIWRFRNEAWPNDAIPPERADAEVTRFIRSHVSRLASAGDPHTGILLEKTVATSLRVPFALRVFPEAKFIHLIRDGRAATESAMRMFRAPPDWGKLFEKLESMPLHNFGYVWWFFRNFISGLRSGRRGGRLWGPRYPGIEEDVQTGRDLVEICATQWAESVRHSLAGFEAVPPDRQITIRYEDLVAAETALRRVCDFCGLADADAILERHGDRVDRSADTKWRTALSVDQKKQMNSVIAPLLANLGYGEENGTS